MRLRMCKLTNEEQSKLECFMLKSAIATLRDPLNEMIGLFTNIDYYSKPKNRKKIAGMITSYVSHFLDVKPTSRQYRKNNRTTWY